MTERNIYVEEAYASAIFNGEPWDVYDDNDWLATFRKKEEAEEYAESKRLEP